MVFRSSRSSSSSQCAGYEKAHRCSLNESVSVLLRANSFIFEFSTFMESVDGCACAQPEEVSAVACTRFQIPDFSLGQVNITSSG